MRIQTLSKLLYVSEVQPRVLRDQAVVVDGSNMFFYSYETSGLSYALGCECDRYAAYLRDYVSMFKKANIKCYFFFKGGSQDLQKSLHRLKRKKCGDRALRPIFTKNIVMDIIEENDFEYFVTEYNSKEDIIEFAQTLDLPIISFDVEYFFSGHQYIPRSSLRYSENDNSIHCDQLLLADFLTKYNLTAEKMATFIVLTDENIYPGGYFRDFFKYLKGPPELYQRNWRLLNWLSTRTTDQILRTISMFLSADEKKTFVEEERKARLMIERRESGGLGAACMLDREAARVARGDPKWFAKGVGQGHIATEYVNLYRNQHFYGSHVPADDEQDDAMTISLEIVKYAYDLLTDFRNDGFKLVYDTREGQETILVGNTYSIRKPVYEAETCVFENGWESVRSLVLQCTSSVQCTEEDAKANKMRIKTLSKLLYVSEVQPRILRDQAVVVDGSNMSLHSYERSGLSYTLGCECDRYAAYLREYVSMFKKANIKCYFFFKGGSQDLLKSLDRLKRKKFGERALRPIFSKNIVMDVIEENDFEYFVTEYHSKKDIIEFAQTLDIPIISFDVEYFFSGHQYIPSSSLRYTESDNSIHCDQLLLADFLTKYNLTAEKMATFIVLTDEKIYPEGYFRDFFKYIKGSPGLYKRNLHLLNWLSTRTTNQISRTIFMFLSADEKKTFVEEERKARLMIERRESGGLGAACMLDREAARVARGDPKWFAKGVGQGHIATEYVNLYRYQTFHGSSVPADDEQDNAMTIALEIVKYAYDLLTDFRNDGFKLGYDTREGQETIFVGITYSIRKPVYEAETCVFENGWESVRSLGLLEHFLRATLPPESLRRVERAPAPARLLLLALAYCARRRPDMPRALPAVALLAHVALDQVHDKADKDNLPKFPFDKKPIVDSTTDKNDVTEADCNVAAAIMEDYFRVSDRDTEHTLDRKLLHSLVEYQQVVLQLQNLNALCGAALAAPVLARSYNGALAYRLLQAAERAADPVTFLDDLLSPAPTVYAYFNGLLETYEDLLTP